MAQLLRDTCVRLVVVESSAQMVAHAVLGVPVAQGMYAQGETEGAVARFGPGAGEIEAAWNVVMLQDGHPHAVMDFPGLVQFSAFKLAAVVL